MVRISLILLFFLFSSYSTIEYKKVYIEWIDIIQMEAGWHSLEEIEEWDKVESDTVKQIGFLYKETKTYIIVIDSHLTGSHMGTATKIPKGTIIKIEFLK